MYVCSRFNFCLLYPLKSFLPVSVTACGSVNVSSVCGHVYAILALCILYVCLYIINHPSLNFICGFLFVNISVIPLQLSFVCNSIICTCLPFRYVHLFVYISIINPYCSYQVCSVWIRFVHFTHTSHFQCVCFVCIKVHFSFSLYSFHFHCVYMSVWVYFSLSLLASISVYVCVSVCINFQFFTSSFHFQCVCMCVYFSYSAIGSGSSNNNTSSMGGTTSPLTPTAPPAIEVTAPTPTEKRQAKALYDYDAADSSELSLLADEVIM